MIEITIPALVILALVWFIVGMMLGVSLSRPRL